MDSADDKIQRIKRCAFYDSPTGDLLFVNHDTTVSICSDCVCRLMNRLCDFEDLKNLATDKSKGH